MKNFLIICGVAVFALTSCKNSEQAEIKGAISDTTGNTNRKLIIPEGYNQGLPFTPQS